MAAEAAIHASIRLECGAAACVDPRLRGDNVVVCGSSPVISSTQAQRSSCGLWAPPLRVPDYLPFQRKGKAMQVDAATVRRIARLARIKVTDAEAKALEKELSGILDWVKQLDEVDTDGVEPMTRVIPMTLKKRPDVVTDGGQPDEIVENAPATRDHFFVVPKVVE